MEKGISPATIALYEMKPMPGMANSVSVISAPAKRPGSEPPMNVTSGISVLRKAW